MEGEAVLQTAAMPSLSLGPMDSAKEREDFWDPVARQSPFREAALRAHPAPLPLPPPPHEAHPGERRRTCTKGHTATLQKHLCFSGEPSQPVRVGRGGGVGGLPLSLGGGDACCSASAGGATWCGTRGTALGCTGSPPRPLPAPLQWVSTIVQP